MRTASRSSLSLAVLVAVGLLGTATAPAQVVDESNAGIQFNFTPPGARSLALGGAFIGLADDATAAYTNPAGLTTLHAPELSLEVRYTSYEHLFTDGGHFEGQITGNGIDTVQGLVFGTAQNSLISPSFLSYVYAGEGWALALYRHQVVDFEAEFQTQGAFFGSTNEGDLGRLFPVKTALDLEIANYGFSIAFDVSDSFSIGVGASYYDFEIQGQTNRYDNFDSTDPMGAGAGQFFGPPLYQEENLFSSQRQTGKDNDLSFNVGLLWRASDVVWLGAVYRHGPTFGYSYAGKCGPSDPTFCSTGYLGSETFQSTATMNMPTVYGVGAAIKPSDAFTITLDWDRVEYSNLVKDMTGIPALSSEFDEFAVDDANEVHIGLEYVMLELSTPVALRLGAWLDPAHQVAYTGDDLALRALWAPANKTSDQWHFSGGLGMSFAGKFQIDFAFDLSERVNTIALSGVYRF